MRKRGFVGALLAVSAGLVVACVSGDDGRSRYDDAGRRNDPYYYGQPYPLPYGPGHGGYETPLERHQEREERGLKQEQKAEDRELRDQQQDEKKALKQADEWGKDDRQRQQGEKRALEQEQKDERKDLKRHQQQERRDWDPWD